MLKLSLLYVLTMDSGELLYIGARLVSGAVAAVLAIVLWSRTRDGAWMFVVLAVIAFYINIVYEVLLLFGIPQGIIPLLVGHDAGAIINLIFSCLPLLFFIIAFALMIARRGRRDGRQSAR